MICTPYPLLCVHMEYLSFHWTDFHDSVYSTIFPKHVEEIKVSLKSDNNNGSGSSVGIATDCGLDGPRIESRWGRDLSHLSRPALGPTQPPVQWVPGLSRW
jgi:hypothetical protein